MRRKSKEASFLLVDGYNIIHCWSSLKELAADGLEDARDKLLEMLSDYRGVIASDIIVVFDAHKVKGGAGSKLAHGNIYVVYTKEAETADHYIERTVKSISRGYNVTVATSDGLEQSMILAEGAARISARELYHQLKTAKEALRKDFIENPSACGNSLFSAASPEAVDFLEKLRFK